MNTPEIHSQSAQTSLAGTLVAAVGFALLLLALSYPLVVGSMAVGGLVAVGLGKVRRTYIDYRTLPGRDVLGREKTGPTPKV